MYEYYWSLGFVDLDGKCGPDTWGGELAQTAAEVYLYFPTTGGWRVEEMLATIKYLCPSREHLSHLKDAAEMFSAAKPIVEDASKLASVGSMLPGVGPIAASSAVLLNTIARLKITSVAPTNDYVWSVQKGFLELEIKPRALGVRPTVTRARDLLFRGSLRGRPPTQCSKAPGGDVRYSRVARCIASSSCPMVPEPTFATSAHRLNSTACPPSRPAVRRFPARRRLRACGWRGVRSAW
jgi:hypothetical protein